MSNDPYTPSYLRELMNQSNSAFEDGMRHEQRINMSSGGRLGLTDLKIRVDREGNNVLSITAFDPTTGRTSKIYYNIRPEDLKAPDNWGTPSSISPKQNLMLLLL